jgi:hypothetical protein
MIRHRSRSIFKTLFFSTIHVKDPRWISTLRQDDGRGTVRVWIGGQQQCPPERGVNHDRESSEQQQQQVGIVTIRRECMSQDAESSGVSWGRAVSSTFLPVGYPSSVSQSYARYVGWQALHHSCSAANGALASAFLLYAAGLGSSTALPTAGAVNWIIKDGLGQMGTLLFAKSMSKNFDSSARLWYVVASIQLNMAIGLEIVSFNFPDMFVLVASAANCMKGLAWMVGGATRTAFNVSFAKMGNIGDITAKATSQTICTSLLGTWVGLGVASLVHQDVGLASMAYGMLGSMHVLSAYKSATTVPLRTLNESRISLIAKNIVNGRGAPTPEDVCKDDALFPKHDDACCPQFDVLLEDIARYHPRYLELYGCLFTGRKYVLIPRPGRRPLVLLHTSCRPVDVLHAGLAVTHLWECNSLFRTEFVEETCIQDGRMDPQQMKESIEVSLAFADSHAQPTLDALARMSWDVSSMMESHVIRAATWN